MTMSRWRSNIRSKTCSPGFSSSPLVLIKPTTIHHRLSLDATQTLYRYQKTTKQQTGGVARRFLMSAAIDCFYKNFVFTTVFLPTSPRSNQPATNNACTWKRTQNHTHQHVRKQHWHSGTSNWWCRCHHCPVVDPHRVSHRSAVCCVLLLLCKQSEFAAWLRLQVRTVECYISDTHSQSAIRIARNVLSNSCMNLSHCQQREAQDYDFDPAVRTGDSD